jgi:hypothetical protein
MKNMQNDHPPPATLLVAVHVPIAHCLQTHHAMYEEIAPSVERYRSQFWRGAFVQRSCEQLARK